MAEIEAHIVIRGRVQGVGFRFSLQRQAGTHSVRGWVRNLSDGSVEALLQGAPEAVHAVIEWAWSGPRSASVHDVEVVDRKLTEFFSEFEIRD